MAEARCSKSPLGTSACAELIRDGMRRIAAKSGEAGCEITVSTAPPLIVGPYGVNGYKCPHGVTYWIEPTSEQIAEWNRAGVR